MIKALHEASVVVTLSSLILLISIMTTLYLVFYVGVARNLIGLRAVVGIGQVNNRRK